MHQVVTAQLAAARAGYPEHEDQSRGFGGRGQALPAEGHRPGPARQHPRPSLRGRRRRPGAEAAQLPRSARPARWSSSPSGELCPTVPRRARSPWWRAGSGRSRAPKTRRHAAHHARADGTVLVVLARDDERAYKSFRNLPGVDLILVAELAAYDVLCSDWVVFTQSTLPGNSTWGEAPPAPPLRQPEPKTPRPPTAHRRRAATAAAESRSGVMAEPTGSDQAEAASRPRPRSCRSRGCRPRGWPGAEAARS